MENTNRYSFYIKNILFSALLGICGLLLLLFGIACIFFNMSLPLAASEWPLIICCGLTGVGAGYICGRRIKENGWLFGLMCGAAIWFVLFIVGLFFSSPSFTGMMVTKLILILVGAMTGGMLGVNKKGKKLKF